MHSGHRYKASGPLVENEIPPLWCSREEKENRLDSMETKKRAKWVKWDCVYQDRMQTILTHQIYRKH